MTAFEKLASRLDQARADLAAVRKLAESRQAMLTRARKRIEELKAELKARGTTAA